jgi:transcriptional regulator with XRE-family HTH domain
LRKLKAKMILRGLSLADVSRLSRVPYNTTSMILNGHLVHQQYLSQIEEAIRKAPVLQEAASA